MTARNKRIIPKEESNMLIDHEAEDIHCDRCGVFVFTIGSREFLGVEPPFAVRFRYYNREIVYHHLCRNCQKLIKALFLSANHTGERDSRCIGWQCFTFSDDEIKKGLEERLEKRSTETLQRR